MELERNHLRRRPNAIEREGKTLIPPNWCICKLTSIFRRPNLRDDIGDVPYHDFLYSNVIHSTLSHPSDFLHFHLSLSVVRPWSSSIFPFLPVVPLFDPRFTRLFKFHLISPSTFSILLYYRFLILNRSGHFLYLEIWLKWIFYI